MSHLAGKRIVITRAPHQAGELETLLRERGAVPLLYPCIDIAPPTNPAPLESAVRAAADGAFDWLVLTSANTVLALRRVLDKLDLKPPYFSGLQVAAVGRATAEAAHSQLGLTVNLLPDEYNADALAETLQVSPGMRILLPQSAIADPTLAAALTMRGAVIRSAAAYQTALGRGGVDLPAQARAGEVDAITFTSASTVNNFFTRFSAEGGRIDSLRAVILACIGSKTAAALREQGFTAAVTPNEHRMEGLVREMEEYFGVTFS
jgi:uroporphyrinogen-III synthase